MSKKIKVLVGIAILFTGMLSGCIDERSHYGHYTGFLLSVLPASTGGDITFYFELKAIILDVERGRAPESVFNECANLTNKTVTLVYRSDIMEYVYCFEAP